MGCATGFMKCCLHFLNTCMLIVGVLFIVLASVMLNSAPMSYVIILYVAGGLNVISAILGCCGICKEDSPLTIAYAIVILISLLAQLSGRFFGPTEQDLQDYAINTVNTAWAKEIQNPGAMNFTQIAYQCCGKNGPEDYIKIGRTYPQSCYKTMADNSAGNLNVIGCLAATQKEFVRVYESAVGSSWGGVVFTIVMLIFAIYLAMRFRNKTRRYDY